MPLHGPMDTDATMALPAFRQAGRATCSPRERCARGSGPALAGDRVSSRLDRTYRLGTLAGRLRSQGPPAQIPLRLLPDGGARCRTRRSSCFAVALRTLCLLHTDRFLDALTCCPSCLSCGSSSTPAVRRELRKRAFPRIVERERAFQQKSGVGASSASCSHTLPI